MRVLRPEPPLASQFATLDESAAAVATAARSFGAPRELRCSVERLERACESLAAATRTMAFAATGDPPRGTGYDPDPRERAVAWRLHHLSATLTEARDACAVIGTVAGAYDELTDAARAPSADRPKPRHADQWASTVAG